MTLVPLTIAANEAEAELVRSLLATDGIDSVQRQTNFGAGAADGFSPGGSREVLVQPDDLERARAILETDSSAG